MPNRLIKETIRTSKNVNSLSDFQFRLWTYLITYVDDYGRGSADPEILKGFVFTRRKGITEKQIDDGMAALANKGMIILYESEGESFFCFPKWDNHQRIRSKKSKFPAPDENLLTHDSNLLTHDSNLRTRDCLNPIQSNPIQSESESESEGEARAPARERHKYGEYKNVLLSDSDMDKLKTEFPGDYEQRIERLSEYLAQTGKSYKNHLATIRNWARRENEKESKNELTRTEQHKRDAEAARKRWNLTYDIDGSRS